MRSLRFVCSCVSFICLVLVSCTEPIMLKTELFEDVLVVEATITNEMKRQQVKVSRTYFLDESLGSSYENNATVKIEGTDQNVYSFSETSNGIYLSDVEFRAIEGVSYRLFVDTVDGKQYHSSEVFLTASATIDSLYAIPITLDGVLGIQVLVNSNENLGEAQFFRYEYEEAYKIVAPYFNYYDAVLANISNTFPIQYDVDLVPRPQEQKTCYTLKKSNAIILTSADGLTESAIKYFPIRFISANDPILRERYSILVKQYVQSSDAYNFYRILKIFGSDESVFLERQPGFLQGNMYSKKNEQDKIIGFFDVSSVYVKRIYFNYMDFGIRQPPYFYSCDLVILDYKKDGPPPDTEVNERQLLYQLLNFNKYKFVAGDKDSEFIVVRPECGDCTTFSSSIKPEFWED